jgi:hypothetical protein
MTSFIFNFRSLLVALCCISALEVLVQEIFGSTLLERSNLLHIGFNENEPSHRVLIYEKLRLFGAAGPDIIQVGDSSGLHAVDPRLLKAHLHGLTYVNLDCCANIGFQGYYDIARYVLDRNRTVKLLVLYMDILNLPQQGMMKQTEFVSPWMVGRAVTDVGAYLNPPSLLFRPSVARFVDSFADYFAHPASVLHPILDTLQDTGGWLPAGDPHMTENEQTAFCKRHFLGDEALYITRDFLGRRTSFFENVMERFDNLAKKNGARLMIIIEAFPCAIDRDWLSNRQVEATRFLRAHPDVVMYPEGIYEQASSENFAVPIHVLPKYHDVATERVGRVLDRVLSQRNSDAKSD